MNEFKLGSTTYSIWQKRLLMDKTGRGWLIAHKRPLALDESNAYAQRLTLAAERMVSRSWMRDPFLDGWMRTPWRLTLGVYHVVIAVLLGYLLFEFWQTQDRTSDGELPSASISIFGSDMTVHPEVQLNRHRRDCSWNWQLCACRDILFRLRG